MGTRIGQDIPSPSLTLPLLQQSDDPQPQADDQRGADHHQKEVAQHLVLDRPPPHGLDKLPFGDFLALRELFKLSRKLDHPFADFGAVN